jgi:hypothetical protein
VVTSETKLEPNQYVMVINIALESAQFSTYGGPVELPNEPSSQAVSPAFSFISLFVIILIY